MKIRHLLQAVGLMFGIEFLQCACLSHSRHVDQTNLLGRYRWRYGICCKPLGWCLGLNSFSVRVWVIHAMWIRLTYWEGIGEDTAFVASRWADVWDSRRSYLDRSLVALLDVRVCWGLPSRSCFSVKGDDSCLIRPIDWLFNDGIYPKVYSQ